MRHVCTFILTELSILETLYDCDIIVYKWKLSSFPRLTAYLLLPRWDGFHFSMEQVWGQCVDDYSIELVSLSRYTWIGNLNYLCRCLCFTSKIGAPICYFNMSRCQFLCQFLRSRPLFWVICYYMQ